MKIEEYLQIFYAYNENRVRQSGKLPPLNSLPYCKRKGAEELFSKGRFSKAAATELSREDLSAVNARQRLSEKSVPPGR